MSNTTSTKTKAPKATSPKAPAKTAPCGCGCGVQTPRRFRPGHDARLAGVVGRALAAGQTTPKEARAALGSDRLFEKAQGIAKASNARVAKKAARQAANEAAKAAYEAALVS